MLKGVGPRGDQRRPERMVKLTDEFVKTLPEPSSYGDVFWDTECPRLAVIKARRGILYRMKLTKTQRKAVGIDTTTVLHRIGYDMPVEEARKKCREIEQAAARGERLYGHNINTLVDKLLDDKPGDGERGYEALMSVLMDAYSQAANGKGDARHSDGQPFERQDMQRIMHATSIDFAIGQAMKKMLECRRLEATAAKRAELLGAIVYAAGAVVALDQAAKTDKPEDKQQEE